MSTTESSRELISEYAPVSKQDKALAGEGYRCIMAALDHSRAPAIMLKMDVDNGPVLNLSPSTLQLVGRLLGAISTGHPFTYMPPKQEFTTVEAANILNVSRTFVTKELEAGNLKYRMVGTHRRIPAEEVFAYAERIKVSRAAALDEMADNARELGLDY